MTKRFTKGEPFNPWRKICGFYPPDIVSANTDLKLTDGQKRLYERAVRWAGRKGYFFYGFTNIADALGKSVRQVKRDMATLEEKGLIAHIRRCRQTNRYRFLWHPIFDVPPTALQDPILDVPYKVKKGVLDVPPTAQELCKEEELRKRTPPTPPHGTPSPSQPKLTGICASDDARVGESALAIIPRTAARMRAANADRRQWFAAWWAIYWRRESKKAAATAFRIHVKTKARFDQVMRATLAQTPIMLAREPDKRPHGATWLNGERWNDEPSAPATARKPPEASLGERTMALWAKRLAKGERPI